MWGNLYAALLLFSSAIVWAFSGRVQLLDVALAQLWFLIEFMVLDYLQKSGGQDKLLFVHLVALNFFILYAFWEHWRTGQRIHFRDKDLLDWVKSLRPRP